MKSSNRWTAALAASLLAVAAVAGGAAAQNPPPEPPKMPATATKPLPPIDLRAPKVFSTATFGLG